MDDVKVTENALTVLSKRYFKKDSEGNLIEGPQDLFMRVASAIAQADRKYGAKDKDIEKISESFYEMMSNLEFMPNSPTLMNAGNEKGQLSACFVLPITDSMEGIFETLKHTAIIHKTGGGTGFSFSNLRQKNSVVKTTGGVASGPVSFMRVFDAATQAVKQGGKRRGANMGMLRIDHPDILEFIQCKAEEGVISNFNISIAITDDFMNKVFNNEEYELINPHTKEVTGTLNAKEVFDLIVKMAHSNGEPGIIFIDKINAENPVSNLGDVESTNPCGEQPLLPYESCNLGSINLAKMLKKSKDGFAVDWAKLRKIVHQAVHFLDNVIDVNQFPIEQIQENTRKTRKIGLGVMGWASMLGFLAIPYDSEEALSLAQELMQFINDEGFKKSGELAKEKGVFPAYKGSIYQKEGLLVRNATVTTIAPTGTISIIAGPTSGGIEPIFALVYYRHVMDGEKLLEVDPSFEYIAKKRGFYSEALMQDIADHNGSIQKIEEVPEDIRKVFITAMDIESFWHIKMQSAFQKYTNNAVSKTINLPNSATLDDVKEAYLLSYKLGCKGITVYRDGSRQVQVLNVKKEQKVKVQVEENSKTHVPRSRTEVLVGTTTKINTGCGNLYVIMNQDESGNFFEVFTQMGKAGGCAASQLEAVGRLVSLALRGGIDVGVVAEQLKGIRCPSPSWGNGKKIFSCADAIARALEKRMGDQHKFIQPGQKEKESLIEEDENREFAAVLSSIEKQSVVGVCPDCGDSLRSQEGCVVCASCGYSRC